MYNTGEQPDLTVVLPCRDEEAAVAACIQEIRSFLDQRGLNGEILVVDNASLDRTAEKASAAGANVIREDEPGYGCALRTGIRAAEGRIILIGDADTTYDFSQLGLLYDPLADGKADVIIGNRFSGGIEKGAMPWSHRWGARWLSALGRWRFRTDVYDFHCGMRGLTKEAASQMEMKTTGMEFATEFIAAAALAGLRIGQVPVSLKKCTLPRSSKLNVIRDGFRHLRFIIGPKGSI